MKTPSQMLVVPIPSPTVSKADDINCGILVIFTCKPTIKTINNNSCKNKMTIELAVEKQGQRDMQTTRIKHNGMLIIGQQHALDCMIKPLARLSQSHFLHDYGFKCFHTTFSPR